MLHPGFGAGITLAAGGAADELTANVWIPVIVAALSAVSGIVIALITRKSSRRPTDEEEEGAVVKLIETIQRQENELTEKDQKIARLEARIARRSR